MCGPLLPSVVFEQICQFIPLHTTLFTLLKALPANALSCALKALLLLYRETQNHKNLWPNLKLRRNTPKTISLVRLVAPMYKTISIFDFFELAELQDICSLAPMVTLHFYKCPTLDSIKGDLCEWYEGIKKFRIHLMHYDNPWQFTMPKLGLESFAHCYIDYHQLYHVSFKCNHNFPMQLQFLNNLPKSTIRSLSLSFIRFDIENLHGLIPWLSLGVSLTIKQCEILLHDEFQVSETLFQFFNAVQISTTLKSLALDNAFTQGYLGYLSTSASSIQVESLSLQCCVQSSIAAPIIISAMEKSIVTQFHVSYWVDVPPLATLFSIPEFLALTSLTLSKCKIADDGCLIIAKTLRQFDRLTHLCLSGNKITNKGAISLARAITNDTSLVEMDLQHNFIQLASVISKMLLLLPRHVTLKLTSSALQVSDREKIRAQITEARMKSIVHIETKQRPPTERWIIAYNIPTL